MTKPDASPPAPERRASPRLQVLIAVRVETDLYGDYFCIARNVSAGGMFLETPDLLPLGTDVRVRFTEADAAVVVRGVVNNHYYLNYADADGPRALAGMSIRFIAFETGQADLHALLH